MIFQAIVLGIIQGLTEFLPISSSAHLFLVPYFFGWDYQGLGFDVALHWGTLLAVLVIFGRDYWRYGKALISSPSPHPSPVRGEGGERKMAWFLVLGTVPAAVAGYFLADVAETSFRNPLITVFTLAGFGFLLWVADRTPSFLRLPLHGQASPPIRPGLTGGAGLLTWKKVLFIGVAQATAIVPGVSRSGVTITAGLFSKLDRQAAARFSFLLSGPVIFGAGLVALRGAVFSYALLAGFLASAISSALAIKFLLKYISTHNFNIFVWYRYALAAVILIVSLVK